MVGSRSIATMLAVIRECILIDRKVSTRYDGEEGDEEVDCYDQCYYLAD